MLSTRKSSLLCTRAGPAEASGYPRDCFGEGRAFSAGLTWMPMHWRMLTRRFGVRNERLTSSCVLVTAGDSFSVHGYCPGQRHGNGPGLRPDGGREDARFGILEVAFGSG